VSTSATRRTRRSGASSSPGHHTTRQDGAVLGAATRAENLWLSLTASGDDSPGLELVPRRLHHIVKPGTDGAQYEWSVSPSVVEAIAGSATFCHAVLALTGSSSTASSCIAPAHATKSRYEARGTRSRHGSLPHRRIQHCNRCRWSFDRHRVPVGKCALERSHERLGRRSSELLDWTTDSTFRIDDTEYVCHPFGGVASTADRFCICKSPQAVVAYEVLFGELAPNRIVEIGIRDGGSTSFFAHLARPEKLVAVDIKRPSSTALDDFIDAQGLDDVIVPYYEVDQADESTLATIVEREFGTQCLDLVVDDASHQLDPTRRTFNALYPRLRPGGMYLIEDWSTTYLLPDQRPMTALILELIMACVDHEAFEQITIDGRSLWVRRGHAEIESGSFDVATCLGKRGRRLRQGV
jgi:predicted O-methyltransferase YrrM